MNIILKIAGISDPSTLACIARARNFKLYCKAIENTLKGECPFCNIDPGFNQVIVENKHWLAWQSPAPEANTRHHFIIVPRKHVVDTEDLESEELMSLFKITAELRRMYGYKGRGFLIRDGDARISAGTIQHLHAHVMVPDGTGRVETPFYKGKEVEEAGLLRAIIYEKLRQGTKYKDLSQEEQKLVEGRI